MLRNNELLIKYDKDYKGKPCQAYGDSPNEMLFYLDKLFQIQITDVVNTRKRLKFIFQTADDETLDRVENWIRENQPLWLNEYLKMRVEMKR